MISSIIEAPFLMKIKPNMSEQEIKWQRIYDLLDAKTKFLCLQYTKHMNNNFYRKKLFKENREWRIEQKTKRLSNCSYYGD